MGIIKITKMLHLVAAVAGMLEVHQLRQMERQTIKPMDSTTTVERYSGYLQQMNTGTMKALQADPENPSGDCIDLTDETNVLIQAMFDPANYTGGVINQAEFQENFQIMSFKGMEQLEACGGNELLIKLDAATNNLSNFIAGSANMATQYGLGQENEDTSLFYATADISAAFGTSDFETLGEGTGLLTSQFIKFEAPDATIEVSP